MDLEEKEKDGKKMVVIVVKSLDGINSVPVVAPGRAHC